MSLQYSSIARPGMDLGAPTERRGWYVVAGATVGMALGFGALALLSVFMRPLEAEFGWSRSEVSFAYAISTIGMAVGGLVWGRVSDRVDIRILLAIGGSGIVLSLLAMSAVQSLWQVYLANLVLGGFGFSMLYAPLLTATGEWFEHRRGLAVGIVTAGGALGQGVLPFVANALIDALGWRTAFLSLGLISLIALATALPKVTRPGGRVAAAKALVRVSVESSTRMRKQFALIAVAAFMCCVCACFGAPKRLRHHGSRDAGSKLSPATQVSNRTEWRIPMAGLRDSILETIGQTPVVRINKLAPEGIELYAKLEAFNPLGSVKDRLALGIIDAAERAGALKPGQTVVEATSGNTGIGLAMVCAQKGYPLVIVMAESFSIERRKLMRFLGAKVVLTPAAAKGTGMVAKARELAEKHGWFFCRQFENEANAEIHSRTTAREILADFEGRRLDYWVTGAGTGGTLRGVSRVLKVHRPDTRIVLCEPDNAPIINSGIGQQYNADGSPADSHPMFRPHLMQGWAPDFIPKLTNDALIAAHVDEVVPVNGNEALRLARELATKEGIFAGISSGATLAGALDVCKRAPKGSTVLCMLPDTGERYLSTALFEAVAETMTEEEEAISASTDGYRFDISTPAKEPETRPIVLPEPAPEALAFVEKVTHDPDEPVVMFALEWCEFCWALRKFFAAHGIPYRSVDLDSVPFQENNLGGEIRTVLHRMLKTPTIPQVFVGGKPIGGCTDTLELFRTGELQAMLAEKHVPFDARIQGDPARFLPKWVHPR